MGGRRHSSRLGVDRLRPNGSDTAFKAGWVMIGTHAAHATTNTNPGSSAVTAAGPTQLIRLRPRAPKAQHTWLTPKPRLLFPQLSNKVSWCKPCVF